MSNSVTLDWFGVLKNQIAAQKFLLFNFNLVNFHNFGYF